MKPVIIYVSGAPGSGKTTLAKFLSEQLYIPHVSSDLVHGGIEFAHPDHDRPQAINHVFVPLIIDMAKRGISFVADHVLQYDIAKETIIDKLTGEATVIHIHTQASHPIERYTNRIETSQLPDIIRRKSILLSRAAHHEKNLVNTAKPVDLGVPSLTVDTDDGYDPTIDKIIDFIVDHKRQWS